MSELYFMNSLSQWLIAVVYIAGGVILAKLAYFLFKKISKSLINRTHSKLDDVLLDTLEKPVVFAITIFGFYVATRQLHKTTEIETLIINTNKVLAVICITWFIARFVNAIIDQYMEPAIELSESKSKKQFLPIITKVVTITIWTIGIIIAFNMIGYNLAGLIAGLGIGGLAFALAAKDYLQNIFGGISIFTDKPFSIDDRIRIDGFDGKVEEIGIRNSRIRTLSGSLVTIPNSIFINNSVENVALEPTRKIMLRLGLTYATTPSKMEESMQILKSIVADHQDIVTDTPVVFFENFADSSLVLLFIYYIKKEADIPSAQSVINLEILNRFKAAQLDFAFPTQTIYTINQ